MAEPRWQAVAALVDPVRRALYDYVRRQDHPVTREEAAEEQAVSRNLAAFHLDKLVDAGLLRARYEAPTDQPRGRGRTPKVYEPADDGLAVTIPHRRYELIGEILADAVADDLPETAEAAYRQAFRHGRRTGGQARARLPAGMPGSDVDELAVAKTALADLGFEPSCVPAGSPHARLTLGNCPFHALAVRQPELICGINRAFIAGVLVGLGTTALAARLLARPGACCVEVCQTPAGRSGSDCSGG